jgi:hypothetical protein
MTSASAISAALSKHGLPPTPGRRQNGIKVSSTLIATRVRVTVNVDSRRRERELIADITEVLTNLGYHTTSSPGSPTTIYVTKDGSS